MSYRNAIWSLKDIVNFKPRIYYSIEIIIMPVYSCKAGIIRFSVYLKVFQEEQIHISVFHSVVHRPLVIK